MLQKRVVVFLIGSALCFGSAAADSVFQFISIDHPGGITTEAQGINPGGDIGGMYVDSSGVVHGFVLRHGLFTTVDYPGAEYTQVTSVSPGGEIVGNYVMAGENPGVPLVVRSSPVAAPVNIHGFVRKRDGTWIPLAYACHLNLIAQRILPDGTVLGCYHDRDFGYWMRGFVWREGIYTALDGTLEGLNVPSSMNNGATPDLGQIAGLFMDMSLNKVRGYVIQKGRLAAFDYPGSSSTRAWDMNPSGAIVGDYRDTTGAHGFVFEDGVFTSVQFPGARVTQARGINPSGVTVGWYQDAQGSTHGFTAIPQPHGQ